MAEVFALLFYRDVVRRNSGVILRYGLEVWCFVVLRCGVLWSCVCYVACFSVFLTTFRSTPPQHATSATWWLRHATCPADMHVQPPLQRATVCWKRFVAGFCPADMHVQPPLERATVCWKQFVVGFCFGPSRGAFVPFPAAKNPVLVMEKIFD